MNANLILFYVVWRWWRWPSPADNRCWSCWCSDACQIIWVEGNSFSCLLWLSIPSEGCSAELQTTFNPPEQNKYSPSGAEVAHWRSQFEHWSDKTVTGAGTTTSQHEWDITGSCWFSGRCSRSQWCSSDGLLETISAVISKTGGWLFSFLRSWIGGIWNKHWHQLMHFKTSPSPWYHLQAKSWR